jgi:hypothetical protein
MRIKEENPMRIARQFTLLGWLATAVVLMVALSVFVSVQAQIPDVSKMAGAIPGGMKVPGMPGKSGFSGAEGLSAAKELYGQQQNKTTYPTPNIAVSGNHVVIAWPNGVVTIETIAQDGAIQRVVIGPPSDKNT